MPKAWITTKDYQGECRRNGTQRIIWTLMVSACGVVFLGLMAWLTSINTHLSAVEAMTVIRGERLSVVETSIRLIGERLERIEDKLYQALKP